ncbi:hypothetical protein HFP89_02635 [Wenzhouxiangella sp. XN79A]|uniref:hypothetical protein n=1 Tax=Wenzhouxiangella sp. XN79A TaxID=2724193 RepID=UPI00144AA7D7|nr:hypothetical protein [Wenzhouxiangella sp. XN79A]NKI34063.1 hypothetical protein [Wenzhouxiangella sp. XN79A]
MLPITNHRVVHIPHSLAVGAAIVGLVVAMNWDRPQDAGEPPPAPAMVTLEDDSGRGLEPAAPGRDRDAPRSGELLPGFGPLVLPFAPGR